LRSLVFVVYLYCQRIRAPSHQIPPGDPSGEFDKNFIFQVMESVQVSDLNKTDTMRSATLRCIDAFAAPRLLSAT
jgi:hypothetical protein